MTNRIVEGFSVSHAAVLNGTTAATAALDAAELQDIYGVRSGSLDVDTDSYDNTGDDAVLSTWSWFNFATVSVQAGYMSFDLISILTGAATSSSGAGAAAEYALPLWNEDSLNQPQRPMIIRVPAKDQEGQPRQIDFVLYKVQFDPITFDGPSYKDGLLVNYSGKALMSLNNEAGTPLAAGQRAIGRVLNRPKQAAT